MHTNTVINATVPQPAAITGTILVQGLPGIGTKGVKGDTGSLETWKGSPIVVSVDQLQPDETGDVTTRVPLSREAYDLIESPDPNIAYLITN